MTKTSSPSAGRLVLVLGGARSGKSGYAERRVEMMPPPYAYVATAQAFDAEMTQRISLHQARRDARWHAHDAPFDAHRLLGELPPEMPLLLDCLTLWLTNHMLADHDLAAEEERLVAAVRARRGLTVLVANEVGLGIVPDNALARRFRDAAGQLNQRMATLAHEVIFMVAGLPMTVKGTLDER
ncbi:bifunctional adenosylcobinamide kinase/adenosylcobinamide-phosphate guanylyltransferase [Xanthobacter sp. DSM 24535]|uniref:bifunctional adenosylcobinamide kinase/adenosylcobinamide-phosphate guanylyltransferase n=1 Tax=Roseixanthobacter psychrophilus TaxID=3119917 RepID=UPI00372CAC4A